MAGRPRGSTNTKTTTQRSIPRTTGEVFWTGGHIYQAYKAQNIWGFDVLMPNGNTLSSLCPQAMDVLNAVFTQPAVISGQTTAMTSLANRSVPRDATNAIPIDSNQTAQNNGTAASRRVRTRVSGSRTPVTSSSS